MTKLLRAVAASVLAATVSLVFISSPAQADRYRDDQWHLPYLKISEVHKLSQGEGITVAVIDTGVEAKHPDLTNNVLPGLDVRPGKSGNGWGDDDGHGTGMAGLIAAHGHGAGNADGVLGIAPKAKILPIRADLVGEKPVFSGTDLLKAIQEAVNRGAKIISLSIETDNSAAVEIQRFLDEKNVIVLAAAGNTSQENLMVAPANYRGVLAVGAVDKAGNVAAISLRDDRLSLTAPGVDIVTSSRITGETQYRKSTGTSPATAIAAGAAAVVWAKNPQWTAKDVIRQLTATATDKGATGRDKEYGFGAVDPLKALTAPLAAASESAGAPRPSVSVSIPGQEGDTKSSSTLIFVGIGIVVLLALLAGGFFLFRRRSS